MAEVQVTQWREIPSLVVARDGDELIKTSLPARFQEAIDEAAMRLGAVGSDAYLEGWSRGEWTTVAGSAAQAADAVTAELVATWSREALDTLLDSYGAPVPGVDE